MPDAEGEAFQTVRDTAPEHTYRGAVVGCGRMGSTIDDEHVGQPHYPWPWAHAPAMMMERIVKAKTFSSTPKTWVCTPGTLISPW